jgi:OmpA-OmpF porin, OOP family
MDAQCVLLTLAGIILSFGRVAKLYELGNLGDIMKLSHWLVGGCVAGMASVHAQDAAGGRGVEVLTPFVGSSLVLSEVRSGTVVNLSLGPGDGRQVPKPLQVEGTEDRRVYVAPGGVGAYEVQKNYEQALKDSGAIKLSSCAQSERCSGGLTSLHSSYIEWALGMMRVAKGPDGVNALNYNRGNYNLGVYKVVRGGSNFYVSVLTSQGANVPGHAIKGRAVTVIDTVLEKSSETGKVALVTAGSLAQGLLADDKVALYGVYFDTGRSEVKPESRPQVAEIAKMLAADPTRKVFIVGHTDSEGDFEANMILSQRRAEALVAVLIKEHGIAAGRLTPKGLANLAPVGSNRTEAGRSKNRRVEVVAR